MERSSSAQDTPIAKASNSFLQENMFSSFGFATWNRGRIVCQRSQLKQILSGIESSSDGSKKDKIIPLSNSPFPGTKMFTNDIQYNNTNSDAVSGTRAELMTSTV